MGQNTVGFPLDPLLRKRIEKRRREAKDARLLMRLSALLWLDKGSSSEEVADLLGVCPRTVRNWLELFREKDLEGLCTLEYKGDPG